MSDILSGEWWDAACVGLAVSHPQTVRLLRAHNAALLALLGHAVYRTHTEARGCSPCEDIRAALGGRSQR